MFTGLTESVVCTDLAAVEVILGRIDGGDGPWVAALDYELGYLLEPASAGASGLLGDTSAVARFWRFADCAPLDRSGAEAWLSEAISGLTADERCAGVGGLAWGFDEDAYRQQVARIQTYIAAGDCYQVNFTFPLRCRGFGHPLALYAALRGRQPVRYGGLVRTGAGTILSLSPELFLARDGDRLVTRPMKGTAARATDPEVLRQSVKDRAENVMIVDLLRSDLGRVAIPGSVVVEDLFAIEDYPTVWQMVSQVAAQVPGRSNGEILRALFPCGSVTGAPKIRAMQIVGELETEPRGLYTGALGWLGPGGAMRLNVAIRTLSFDQGGHGRLGVGSGIVADSVAAAEWRECQLKARFLTDLDPPLKLIETLRREEGRIPRLAGHLDRLGRSAAWFGFAFDAEAVQERLQHAGGDEGVWRIRLTLAKDGHVAISATALAEEPGGERLALLAAAAVDSRNPLQGHKTTAREPYDRALAAIAARPEVFDVVFCNERGELAEGARSTLFVPREGVLFTPPLASGALPGVLRAELLAAGLAREQILFPTDLGRGFLLGNALRGLVPVRLGDGWVTFGADESRGCRPERGR